MDTKLTIRDIRPDDVEEVSAMWALLARQHAGYDRDVWAASDHAVRRWARMLTEAIDDPQAVALTAADETGRLLGFTLGRVRQGPEVYPPGLVGQIWDLFVHPDARGRGVGSALTEAILDALDRLGARCAELHVARSNPAAQGLYEKLGFRPVMTRMYTRLPRQTPPPHTEEGTARRRPDEQT